jgi:alkylation response protein AidB-like acyl-CoA dehydrogenase
MNERASIGGERRGRGAGPIGQALDEWAKRAHGDPARRDYLMRLRSRAEILWLTAERARQLQLGSNPGPEASILKLAQATLDQSAASFALELMGPEGMLVPDYDGLVSRDDSVPMLFLFSPAFTIAGGTAAILKNILAERVLGLPPDERTDRDLPWKDLRKG